MRQWLGNFLTLALLMSIAVPGQAGLIGVTPLLPETEFGSLNGQGIDFDSSNGIFNAIGVPLETKFDSGRTLITGESSFNINILVNSQGEARSGTASHDLIVQGSMRTSADPLANATNTLLTGTLLDFGYLDIPNATTDVFDFLFQVTGGEMAGDIPSDTLGVFMVAEFSSFAGGFESNFTSQRIKGSIGPTAIPPQSVPAPATLWLLLLGLPILVRYSGRIRP